MFVSKLSLLKIACGKLLAITLTGAGGLSDARAADPPAEFWRDPAFVEKFVGTYGFVTDVEPRVTREEQELLRELSERIATDPAGAAEDLRNAIDEDSSAALDFVLGNLHFERDQLGDAERRYNIALEKFPNFMRAHKNLGIVRIRQDDFDGAARSLTRAIELGGGDGTAYGLLGLSRLNQERYHSAESAYRQALLFDPDNTQWRLGTARVLLAQERYQEASALLEELIDEQPANGDYYLYQANAFLGMDEPRRAALNYEAARRLDAATAEAMANLADIYVNQQMPDLAAEVWREALAADRGPPFSRALRGARALAERRAWNEALALADTIEARYEDDWDEGARLDLLYVRARIQLETGETAEAVYALHHITERRPRDGDALLLLAGHYADSGQPERAEILFERAARSPGHEAEAYLRHGTFLVREGRLERAAELLRRSQELRPREAVQRYLERVEEVLAERS